MRPVSAQNLVRELIAFDDMYHAWRRKPYLYPERVLNPPPPKWVSPEQKRAEGSDKYGPLRAWVRDHAAAWRDLTAIDSIIDQIPPALIPDGVSPVQVSRVVSRG